MISQPHASDTFAQCCEFLTIQDHTKLPVLRTSKEGTVSRPIGWNLRTGTCTLDPSSTISILICDTQNCLLNLFIDRAPAYLFLHGISSQLQQLCNPNQLGFGVLHGIRSRCQGYCDHASHHPAYGCTTLSCL